MKWLSIILVVSSGCYYLGQNTYRDIVVHPSSGWSGPEELTVIMEAGNHNLLDLRTNVKAIATPYYPSVVKAIGRRAQELHHWSEEEFHRFVDALLRDASAMFVDWDKSGEPVYDSHLDPLVSPVQFDSIMVLLTLRNIGGPVNPPDITTLDGRIFLVNEQGSFILPSTVWGRKMNYLTNMEETLFLKFRLREGAHHFFEHSRRYDLVIRGLESDIKLRFSTALMN